MTIESEIKRLEKLAKWHMNQSNDLLRNNPRDMKQHRNDAKNLANLVEKLRSSSLQGENHE